jgi:hypothetical protein
LLIGTGLLGFIFFLARSRKFVVLARDDVSL